MNNQNHFKDILTSDGTNRKMISENVYNEVYEELLRQQGIAPTPKKRRNKRIAIFKNIIGQGNESVLEIGCGIGDLTCSLIDNARHVVGVDISGKAIEAAKKRRDMLLIRDDRCKITDFFQMSGVYLDFPNEFFDWVISTSMIEHLHPEDVETHLLAVLRVLKPGGRYLVWCPNRLGYHKEREGHLSMFSHSELIERMKSAGFRKFKTSMINSHKLIDARYKVLQENILSALRIKFFWSHLGIRNILLIASK